MKTPGSCVGGFLCCKNEIKFSFSHYCLGKKNERTFLSASYVTGLEGVRGSRWTEEKWQPKRAIWEDFLLLLRKNFFVYRSLLNILSQCCAYEHQRSAGWSFQSRWGGTEWRTFFIFIIFERKELDGRSGWVGVGEEGGWCPIRAVFFSISLSFQLTSQHTFSTHVLHTARRFSSFFEKNEKESFMLWRKGGGRLPGGLGTLCVFIIHMHSP